MNVSYQLEQFSAISYRTLANCTVEEFALSFSDGACFTLLWHEDLSESESLDVVFTCKEGTFSDEADSVLAYRCLRLGIKDLFR